MRRCARAAGANGVDVETRRLAWDDFTEDGDIAKAGDVVVATDCVYAVANVEPLVRALKIAAKPGGEVLVCCRAGRRGVAEAWAALEAAFGKPRESVENEPAAGRGDGAVEVRVYLRPGGI